MSTPMNLIYPTIGRGGTPGPNYAQNVNDDLQLLEYHNHSSGKGVQVPTAGLKFDADFAFNVSVAAGLNAYGLRSVRFAGQTAPLTTMQDLGCLYVSTAGDLWFNNGGGTGIQITAGNVINPSYFGGISGLAGTQGVVNFSSGAGTYQFNKTNSLLAVIIAAGVTLRNVTGFGWSIAPQSGQAASYTLSLPLAPPGSTLPVVMDTSGTLSTAQLVAAQLSATAGIAGSQLSASAGIVGSQLSGSAGITGAQLAGSANIAGSQLSATAGIVGGQLDANAAIAQTQITPPAVTLGSSCGSATTSATSATPITNPSTTVTMHVSIVSKGRPIVLVAVPDSTGSAAGFTVSSTGTLGVDANLLIAVSGGATATIFNFRVLAAATAVTVLETALPPSAVFAIYLGAVLGTSYTFTVQYSVTNAGMVFNASNMQLAAHEL